MKQISNAPISYALHVLQCRWLAAMWALRDVCRSDTPAAGLIVGDLFPVIQRYEDELIAHMGRQYCEEWQNSIVWPDD